MKNLWKMILNSLRNMYLTEAKVKHFQILKVAIDDMFIPINWILIVQAHIPYLSYNEFFCLFPKSSVVIHDKKKKKNNNMHWTNVRIHFWANYPFKYSLE